MAPGPSRLAPCGLVLVAGCSVLVPLLGATPEPGGNALWRRNFEDKILYVVNASRSSSSPAPSLSGVLSTQGETGFVKPKDQFESFELGSVRLVQSEAGVVLLVVEERGDRVRLVALDSESGATRWERRGLVLDNRSGFMVFGSVILTRFAQDELGKAPPEKSLLNAFSIHDGRVLWRNQDLPDDPLQVIAVPSERLLLVREVPTGMFAGLGSYLVALDLDSGLTKWRLDSTRKNNCYWLPYFGHPSTGITPGFEECQSSYYQAAGNFYADPASSRDLILGGYSDSRAEAARHPSRSPSAQWFRHGRPTRSWASP